MSSSSSIVGDLWRSELEIEFPRTVRVLIDYFRRNGFIRIDRELVEKYPEYKWSLYRGWWNTALDIYSLILFFNQVVVLLDPVDEKAFRERYGLSVGDFIDLVERGVVVPVFSGQPREYRYNFYKDIVEATPSGKIGWFHRLTETLKSIYIRLYRDVLADTKEVHNCLYNLFREHGLPSYMAYRGFTSIDYASMDLATRITDLVVTGYRDLVVDILRSSNVEHIVASITLAHHLLVEPNIDSFGGLAVLSKTDLEAIDKVKNTEIGVFLYHLAYSLGVSTTVAVPRRYHRRCIDEYLESSDINELRKIVFRVKEEVAGMSLENIRDTIDNVRSELQEIARNAVQVSREIANKHMHKTRKASHILGVIAQIPLSYITIAEAGLLSPLLVTILQAIVSTTTQKIIDRIARSFWREQLVQLTPYNPVILSIYK